MAAPSSWKAWRSVSVAWARMGTEVPAKLEELLAGIGAAIDAVGGSFTMRYTTVAVTAARTGAASPAFTPSAPDLRSRHGQCAPAHDSCQPGAYPIVLATYELVCSKYADAQTATAVRAFLQATVGPGQADLEDYGYFPLPNQFQSKVVSAVDAIS